MTSVNSQLWGLIRNHKMPDDAAGISFIEQLMEEHRISLDTATTAIIEYKKFMYLCATRHARNVPSKAVDLVWHLHMQHSRDYWDVFCKLLGKPVHHTPGGQGRGHLDDYKATVAAYRDVFGTPPKGIWRQKGRGRTIFELLFTGAMTGAGVHILVNGGISLIALLWTGIFLFSFLTTLNSLTTKGEFTLVFEIGDPFANDDAGDCGSGDGGGCGDQPTGPEGHLYP